MTININRRSLVIGTGLALFTRPSFANTPPTIQAYRNPGCGCCEKWVEHMRQEGFDVTMTDDPALAARRTSLGVPEDLAGCHTALIGTQIIEGHVPAEDVTRFLTENGNGRGTGGL
jgi:hypothetical protein